MLRSLKFFKIQAGYHVISTAEKDKALTGILYAKNAQKNKWIDDVRVIFLGPFENLVCEDDEVIQAASESLDYKRPIACKFLSDQSGASDKLEKLGFNVELEITNSFKIQVAS